MIEIDMGDLSKLGDDLAGATERVIRDIHATTKKAAQNIKEQMQREAAGVAHAPALPGSISYETAVTSAAVTAEVGPREGGVGSLALLYFGNSKSGPRLPDPIGALEREAPAWTEYVAQAAASAVLP